MKIRTEIKTYREFWKRGPTLGYRWRIYFYCGDELVGELSMPLRVASYATIAEATTEAELLIAGIREGEGG